MKSIIMNGLTHLSKISGPLMTARLLGTFAIGQQRRCQSVGFIRMVTVTSNSNYTTEKNTILPKPLFNLTLISYGVKMAETNFRQALELL